MFFFPIRKQLEFACKKCSDFAPSNYPIQRALFTFSNNQLIEHIREHKEIYEFLMSQLDDKRYGPATIIIPVEGNFLVGRFEDGLKFEYYEIQLFDNLVEATSDYVLLNWKLPRLRLPQTEKILRSPDRNTFFDKEGNVFAKIKGNFKYYDETEKKFIYYD